MSPNTRNAKKHAKASKRRYLKAQERLARDRRQAQQAAQALEQALHALGLPKDLVTEIEGRLRSQKKLLGKIVGVMFPPLFGCRTNTELCRVRGWDKNLPSRLLGAMTRSSKSMASSWAWWALGGAARNIGCSWALMASSWSSSSAMAS